MSFTRYTEVFHGFFTEVGVFTQAEQAIGEVGCTCAISHLRNDAISS